jgi:ABC-type glutathione transport system ATPase component
MPSEALLEVRDLHIELTGGRKILSGASLDIAAGSIAGLFGDSGCGKSTLARALLGLLPPEQYRVRGDILLRGRNLARLHDDALTPIRGAQISLIFQDPLLALNPVLTVRTQVAEVLRVHGISGNPASLLEMAGLPDPKRILASYPHQLSGGERQRVTIAQALSCRPALIVADEPFTALDAPRILDLIALFRRWRAEQGASFLLITHHPGVLAAAADRIFRLHHGTLIPQERQEPPRAG